MNKKVEKIVFFNNKLDVDEYLTNNRDSSPSKGKKLFIAMTPSAYVQLNRNGIEAENTLKYFSNGSHEAVLKKSEKLVDWLEKNCNLVDLGIGVHQSLRDSFIIWTRLVIHFCLWSIEIMVNAAQKHNPKVLSASCLGRKAVSNICLEPEEKYLGHITQIVAQVNNLTYEEISRKNSGRYNLFVSRLKNNIALLLKFNFRYLEFVLWERMLSVRSIFGSASPFLFTTFYNMDELLGNLRDEKVNNPLYFLKGNVSYFYLAPFNINFLSNLFSGKIFEQKQLFKNLEDRILEQRDLFSYRNIPFSSLVVQKLKDNIINYILGQLLWMLKINKTMDALSPAAVLSSGDRRYDITLAELCKNKNIPSFLISHGSHVGPKNEYERIEWGEHGRSFLRSQFSSLVLQSPLAEGYLKVFPSAARVIKTGPIVWGRPTDPQKSKELFKKMFKEKYDFSKTRIILHAGTPKPSYTLRFQVYETPDEYIQSICELAKAVEKIPNTILIVKFRPQRHISKSEIEIDDLKHLVPFSEKVILSTEESFANMLGISDLLVSFSSTTIEESLQNKTPVLLYGGGGRYQHVLAHELRPDFPVQKSAVYYVKEAKDLEYGISQVISLDIKRNKDTHLFDPYIYAPEDRVSLVELLKSGFKKAKTN